MLSNDDHVASVGVSKVCTRGLVFVGYGAKMADEDHMASIGVFKVRGLVSTPPP